MNGGASGPDDQWTQAQQRGWAELVDMFGPVSASTGFDLADVGDDPPWQLVSPSEVAGLMTAYRHGQSLATELQYLLLVAGVQPEEMPTVRGSVDRSGDPVVALGEMTVQGAEQLALILRRRPNPPAEPGKAA